MLTQCCSLLQGKKTDRKADYVEEQQSRKVVYKSQWADNETMQCVGSWNESGAAFVCVVSNRGVADATSYARGRRRCGYAKRRGLYVVGIRYEKPKTGWYAFCRHEDSYPQSTSDSSSRVKMLTGYLSVSALGLGLTSTTLLSGVQCELLSDVVDAVVYCLKPFATTSDASRSDS
jgi:hypothetical protein